MEIMIELLLNHIDLKTLKEEVPICNELQTKLNWDYYLL